MTSILLGIWAVKGTIALRNILLWVEAVLSGIYCVHFFKVKTQRQSLIEWIPLIFLGLMFCWVILHFFFLTRYPQQQFQELTSTWLRAGLATIVGLGTGLAITRRPHAFNFLWMGVLLSFVYLYSQYIPKAIVARNFFVPDYSSYIFYGKIGGVLAGTILIMGVLGGLIDTLRRAPLATVFIDGIFCFIATSMVLYAHVFIFDTRNGIGLVILLYLLAIITFGANFFRLMARNQAYVKRALVALLFFGCSIAALGWFGVEQIKHNPGWLTMWEDVKVAIQIDKYPNWQNPKVMGYPINADGALVKPNTYERFAWASSGVLIFLPENSLGIGILSNPFPTLLIEKYPNAGNYIPSTHSAWVEIALAFGYPGFGLFLASLLSIFLLQFGSNGEFRSLASISSLGLLILYTVGELSTQHAIEILCFLIALINSISSKRFKEW